VRSDKPRPLDLHVGSPGASSVPVAAARGALLPGTYYTSRFRPAFRFDVPEGWKLEAESGGLVYLTRGSFPDNFVDLYLFVPGREAARVVTPPLVRDDEPPGEVVAPFPRDYVDYIARSPYLDAGPPTPGELFGLRGTSVDALVSRTPADGICNRLPGTCFSLFRYGIAAFSEQVEPPGATFRVWSLDSEEGPLIVILSTKGDFATLVAGGPELNSLLGSVQFL
jgi:hypothetical protein